MALVIGQVEAIGIGFGDPVTAVTLVVIPPDKVDSIGEIIAICAVIPRTSLIGFPGATQGLGVAIGIRWPGPRNNAKKSISARASHLRRTATPDA